MTGSNESDRPEHLARSDVRHRTMEGRRTPRLGDLARVWAAIGSQSIGGGSSTLLLMRRELVGRHAWVTAREFLEDFVLSKLSPGINHIAFAALVGTRLAGKRGLAVSVVSMLLPAGVITALLTAGYGTVRDDPVVIAALAGAGPVSAGIAAGTALIFARQVARRGWRAGADWAYLVIAAAAGLFTGVPTLGLIAFGIAVGALFLRGQSARASGDPGT